MARLWGVAFAMAWSAAAAYHMLRRPDQQGQLGEHPEGQRPWMALLSRGSGHDMKISMLADDDVWASVRRRDGSGTEERSAGLHRLTDSASLVGVVLLLLIALSPVLYSQGPKAFLAVVMYIISICFVKVFAKQAFNQGFKFPYTLTAMHMLATAIVSSLIDRPLLTEAVSTLRISAVKAISLGLNNSALLFGTAAFVSVIGALTPCTTFAVDVARTRQMPLFRTAAILVACAGAAICTGGELKFSLAALLLALGACLARSLKTVWSHDLLEANVGVYRLVAWSSIWSFVIMLIVGLSVEGREPYRQLPALSGKGLTGLLVSCVAAAILNILQCFVLKFLGPVVQNIFGSLELVAVIILAVVLLGEQVTRLEWIGAILVCLGCAAVKAEDSLRARLKHLLHGAETEGEAKQKPLH